MPPRSLPLPFVFRHYTTSLHKSVVVDYSYSLLHLAQHLNSREVVQVTNKFELNIIARQHAKQNSAPRYCFSNSVSLPSCVRSFVRLFVQRRY